MKPIRAEIIIDAPARRVWSIITDFDRYPEWNTFTPRITLKTADFSVGAEFDLDCRMTGKLLLENEHEAILAVNAGKFSFCMGTSRTRGRPGIKSFRWQICEPLDNRHTRFINYEEFHGPLAPLVQALYAGRLRAAFRRYCGDLKACAESKKLSPKNKKQRSRRK